MRWLLAAWLAPACVGPLPSPELIDRLEILGVKSSPDTQLAAFEHLPIVIATLAADPGGIAAEASYEYGVCLPGPLPPAGPPDCLPPAGVALPTEQSLGWLDLSALGLSGEQLLQFEGLDAGSSLYVSIRVSAHGQQALGLKRIGSVLDDTPGGTLLIDGVRFGGDEAALVTQGEHALWVEASCPNCAVSWYFTGGAVEPPPKSGVIVDDNVWTSPVRWVASGGAGTVWVFAVTRDGSLGGGESWAWGQLDVSP